MPNHPGLIVIPTYNERHNIQTIITKLFSLYPNIEILVVDDNSPDGTAQVVKTLQQKYKNKLWLIVRKQKEGLGKAYITGFSWALKHKPYTWIGEMDADLSHQPEELHRLTHPVESGKADVSIGSRYISGGRVLNWPINRILLSRSASIYVRLLTGMPVNDPTSGFVIYTRKALQTIPFERIPFKGYAFQIAMKYLAWKLGLKLIEVPITFVDRVEGSSKMNKKIVWEAIWGVPWLRLNAKDLLLHEKQQC